MGFDTGIFVHQPVDTNLICNICLSVQNKPTTICQNGHSCCASCIQSWEERDHTDCPECREPLLMTKVLNRPLQSIISSLQVKCQNKRCNNTNDNDNKSVGDDDDGDETNDTVIDSDLEDSESSSSQNETSRKRARRMEDTDTCPWEGTLSDYLGEHKNGGCDFKKVRCIYCRLEMAKIDFNQHVTTGCRRPCNMCGSKVQASQLDNHRKNLCLNRRIQCNLCQQRLQAHLLDHHLDRTCPNRQVSCPWCHEEMSRKELGKAVYDDEQANHYYCTNHLSSCSQMQVYCEYHGLGCTAPRMKRQDLAEHHTQSAQYHARLVAPAVRALQDGTQWIRKSIQWDIPSEKLRKVCAGGVESRRINVTGIKPILFFKLVQDVDGTIDAKILAERLDNSEDAPILFDQVVFESMWGDHVCRLESESATDMSLDPDDRNWWSVSGTLKMESRNDLAISQFCFFDDLVHGTNEDGVYSLEVQFKVRPRPSKNRISCI